MPSPALPPPTLVSRRSRTNQTRLARSQEGTCRTSGRQLAGEQQSPPRRLSFTLTLFTAVPCAHVRPWRSHVSQTRFVTFRRFASVERSFPSITGPAVQRRISQNRGPPLLPARASWTCAPFPRH